MIFAGSGEHLAARGAEEPDSSGALQQAAGPGGVATGDGGPTDRLSRGPPHPPGPTDRPVRATTGTPAKGQRSQKGLCQTVLPKGAEDTVELLSTIYTVLRKGEGWQWGCCQQSILDSLKGQESLGGCCKRIMTVLPKGARVILGSP